MKTEEIKDGDIVTLKSGGPKMTVISHTSLYGGDSKDCVICDWFDGNKRMKDTFEIISLKLAE